MAGKFFLVLDWTRVQKSERSFRFPESEVLDYDKYHDTDIRYRHTALEGAISTHPHNVKTCLILRILCRVETGHQPALIDHDERGASVFDDSFGFQKQRKR